MAMLSLVFCKNVLTFLLSHTNLFFLGKKKPATDTATPGLKKKVKIRIRTVLTGVWFVFKCKPSFFRQKRNPPTGTAIQGL